MASQNLSVEWITMKTLLHVKFLTKMNQLRLQTEGHRSMPDMAN